MGYTTEFKGQFDLNQQMNNFGLYDQLTEWHNGNCKGFPIDGYCQWVLTKDRLHIKWDGNEKFYNYQKWLQVIIDQLLLPNHYSLSGEVEFQGEDIDDHGFLYIENNKVLIRKLKVNRIKCPHCNQWIQLDKKEEI